MLTFFYKACTSILVIKLLHENRFLIEKVLLNILYKGIQLYSKCQIYIIPKLKYLYELYNSNSNSNINNYIQYYKNGFFYKKDLIKNVKNSKNNDILEIKNKLYDFVVYNEYQNKLINKVCISIFPFILNTKYEISNIKFLSFSLTIKNLIIDIILKNNIYNYYIVNNIINKTFIYYYLLYINLEKNKQIQEIIEKYNININTIKYKINFMDNNVNIINIDEKSEIIIKKDEYLINKNEVLEVIEEIDEDFVIA